MPEEDKPLILIVGGHLDNKQLNALLSALENISEAQIVVNNENEAAEKRRKTLLSTGIGLTPPPFDIPDIRDISSITPSKKQLRNWRPQDAFKKNHRHRPPKNHRK